MLLVSDVFDIIGLLTIFALEKCKNLKIPSTYWSGFTAIASTLAPEY